MYSTELGINFFGNESNKKRQLNKIEILKKNINNFKIFLVIAGTSTSQISGISAAGINAKSRRTTALADAEFFLNGASKDHKYKLPLLNAGVTPALISHVCLKLINIYPVIVPLGIGAKPYFNHLVVEDRDLGPSNCLTTGKSMTKERVLNLYEKGLATGRSSKQPILISESVPGGTTTAQAVMEAFGLRVSNLVGSSLFKAPRELRRKVVQKGLLNAKLKTDFDPFDVIAAVGDPFQAFSMGLLIGARLAKQPVMLSGGSQMLAIILLVLEFLDVKNQHDFIEDVFIATTGWLVKDNSLNDLLNLINEKYDVELLGLASPLNFKSSKYKELKDYELGHVKEGVGAGGISLLAFLHGFKNEEIVSLCQQNLEMMKGLGQISLEKDC
ncbi:nicotinate mononucleotide-dependent phosphoribosyltransferase CobT [Prochlorococcus marinus]|uniref:nicotinate mononucleotide-dependent phosphoribosyltransferase CobT n=1 Tax=Prochlorococcus marinus TaxID=1219 RepID=UPI001ADCEDC3|nr:TIGR00303 family protein [Prochlorococcus marinus]MBO8216768.1 TIGR00303 family protein [Prochlorococcus marinus XMU1405]MBW3039968.1 TIGR00303 family protein [Prochlorococcus marinus str. MU1405]MBW3047426.1 TIGR00303 family protein [Prochlorococcus marinus str. MU1406]